MKKLFVSIIIIIILFFTTVSFAHKGRTDSDGGHYDSSIGSYHYHHGYPAHQHTDGKCPYDYTDNFSLSTTNISSSTDNAIARIEYLEKENKNLINSIYNLNSEINKYKKELQKKESTISSLWIIFIILDLISIYISYNIGLYNKNSN